LPGPELLGAATETLQPAREIGGGSSPDGHGVASTFGWRLTDTAEQEIAMTTNRRQFLRRAAAATGAGLTPTMFPPAIRKALAIHPHRRTGTIEDVEHIVVLMQENRSFDHYFGTLQGVRGFGDRFPIPVPDSDDGAGTLKGRTVWYQNNGGTGPAPHVIAPFHLDTRKSFELMRVTGTPHGLSDALHAWGDGVLNQWPRFKNDHSMGYFTEDDIPFQFAMAEAFTICDDYHCSIMSSTNPNRLFVFTGTNDPLAKGGGPAINNNYEDFSYDPEGGYAWVTYAERLQTAGITWQVYENMDDNFGDNSLQGFKTFRDAYRDEPGSLTALKERGVTTRDLDKLLEDVTNGTLPQVSWVVGTAEGSEHPGPSSPAQGADYVARVLEALTANPEVWNRTVLFVNFDENDGFFDHVPPPAAPTYLSFDPPVLAGDSTVSTLGEYHEILVPSADEQARSLQHKPYGLGARVPLHVLSPWTRGGWVNSEVADHTSVIRFIEKRFGVVEPNITPWRRAVCGDLTSAFDFADPHNTHYAENLPDTAALAERARALPKTTTPTTPALPELPVQASGSRPSRALPYELHVTASVEAGKIALGFVNSGKAGACFHVYDRKHLDRAPRRYTVEAGKRLGGAWAAGDDGGAYDLWVLAPNGFHRHFTGMASAAGAEIRVGYDAGDGRVMVKLRNQAPDHLTFEVKSNAYEHEHHTVRVGPGRDEHLSWSLRRSGSWYDFTVQVKELTGFSRRFAGRVETGRSSFSDPALGGPAKGDQD
jgi:phospholipase C